MGFTYHPDPSDRQRTPRCHGLGKVGVWVLFTPRSNAVPDRRSARLEGASADVTVQSAQRVIQIFFEEINELVR